MAVTTAWTYPGTAASVNTSSSAAWVNPSALTYGSATRDTIVAAGNTDTLKVTNFGFAIPSGATITGIALKFTRAKSYAAATVKDKTVQLQKSGSYVGSNKAATYTNWPTIAYPSSKTYGGASDLWGTTWTPAQINNSAFGAGIIAGRTDSNSVYAEIDHLYIQVTYTEPLTVTTQAASSVEATTATGNGNITAIGSGNATTRGFCYTTGISGDPTTAQSTAFDTGSFGVGAYTKGLTGLSPGTSYRVRAYAIDSAGTTYGTTVQIQTKPAAPTNVAATNGDHSDKVTVTWSKATGATAYQIYRDGTPLGWLGDVATGDDTGADAPVITPGTAAASDGTSYLHVELSLSGESVANGTTHTYKVRAKNATGEGADSSTDTGYRAPGAITYQWQRSAADSDASYSNITGATTDPHNDTDAPANGDGRYYKCVLDATGATQATSTADRGSTTGFVLPTVTTQAATRRTHTSARGNGNITDDGGGDRITEHGVCWKLGSDPTNIAGSDDYAEDGAGVEGPFTSEIFGLSTENTYYYRAYATNPVGTSYGEVQSFRTITDFAYAGLAPIELSLATSSEVAELTFKYTGTVVLALTAEGAASFVDLIIYTGLATLHLGVSSSYKKIPFLYTGSVVLRLTTASSYYGTFAVYYNGNITLALTITSEEDFVYIPAGTLQAWTLWRVEVDHADGTIIDISDRVYSLKINGNLGDGDEKITLMLRNHSDWVEENLSLDPLDEASTLNQDASGDFDPLLLGRHEVRVYLKYEGEADWDLRWQGFAMSSNCVHIVTMNDTITFKPYGITHIYKADQRLTKWDYRDRTLNSMLPSILMDSGFKGDRGHVIIRDDPAKAVDTFVSEEDSAWDVMQEAVSETGYILASRYALAGVPFNDGSGLSTSTEGYFLTLYDPIRVAGASTWDVATGYAIGQRVYYSGVVYHCIAANTGQQPPNSTYWEVGVSSATSLVATQRPVDATFDRAFRARKIDANLDDVRTLIQVVYHDRETTDGERKSVIVKSDSSRLRHGIPAGDGTKLDVKMRLVEQRGTNIDTLSEATDFAYATLHDLQEPSPDGQVDLPYFFTYVQMHEWYRFIEDDYTIDLGITGYSLAVTADNPIGRTTFKGTINRVIGRHSSLLAQDMTDETRWTRRLDFLLGAPEALPQPTGLTIKAYPINSTMSELRISWDQCNAWWFDNTAIWLSRGTETRYGSDPVAITTKNRVVIGPYPVNETYYVKARHMPWKRISQSGVSS